MPKPPIEGLYALTPEGIDRDELLDKVEAALHGGFALGAVIWALAAVFG